jgi:arylformamidase
MRILPRALSRLSIAALALCLAHAPHAAAKPQAGPAATPTDSDVAYGPDPANILDLYRPASKDPAPLIVVLHGGGWRAGGKKLGAHVAPPLVAQGYAVAALDYRETKTTTPAQEVQDAALGVAYLLHNAARFGLRTDQFAVLGHSSGSHMAALLGIDPGYLQRDGVDPARLAAVVTLDGVFDVQANLTHFPNEQREEPFGADPAQWKLVSPVDLMDRMKTRPRFCVIHEDTKPRFIEQATLFEAALRKYDLPFETLTAHGLGHGALAYQFAATDQPMAAFTVACLARAFARK